MKKFILPALIVGALTLFSFTKPVDSGVRKIEQNLYAVEKNSYNEADARYINQVIQETYKITDLQIREAGSAGIELKATAGKAIHNRVWLNLAVHYEHFAVWDLAANTEVDNYRNVIQVVDKYAR